MEKETFQRGMAYLAAAYDREVSRERAAVYWDQLGGLHDEPFLVACKVAVGSLDRFPTVSRLRELYSDELRRVTMAARPKLPPPGKVSREKVRQMIRGLRERMR
jgi:hypothetical protein